MAGESIADQVAAHLSRYVGAHTARTAVRTFAARALHLKPEQLTEEHVPALAEALEPVLKTLAGEAAAKAVLDELIREVQR